VCTDDQPRRVGARRHKLVCRTRTSSPGNFTELMRWDPLQKAAESSWIIRARTPGGSDGLMMIILLMARISGGNPVTTCSIARVVWRSGFALTREPIKLRFSSAFAAACWLVKTMIRF
jgi:hypothetical protein